MGGLTPLFSKILYTNDTDHWARQHMCAVLAESLRRPILSAEDRAMGPEFECYCGALRRGSRKQKMTARRQLDQCGFGALVTFVLCTVALVDCGNTPPALGSPGSAGASAGAGGGAGTAGSASGSDSGGSSSAGTSGSAGNASAGSAGSTVGGSGGGPTGGNAGAGAGTGGSSSGSAGKGGNAAGNGGASGGAGKGGSGGSAAIGGNAGSGGSVSCQSPGGSCEECLPCTHTQSCASASDICDLNAECGLLRTCVDACPNTGCVTNCIDVHADGVDDLVALQNCECSVCANVCGVQDGC